ncbi:hypothetical protein H9P43_007115 [Blastocladiella emersonii ATCC 22665]|nr:hypothetical protein H9P43_007115 [Blastocladiella emersonii ATCC 22665]
MSKRPRKSAAEAPPAVAANGADGLANGNGASGDHLDQDGGKSWLFAPADPLTGLRLPSLARHFASDDADEHTRKRARTAKSNRGRKLESLLFEEQPDAGNADEVTLPSVLAPLAHAVPSIEEAKFQSKTGTRLFAYAPPAEADDVTVGIYGAAEANKARRAQGPAGAGAGIAPDAEGVNVAAILQPAADLDHILKRRELQAMFKPKHLDAVTSSVLGLIKSEQPIYNTLVRFVRVLQNDTTTPIDIGDPERKAREAAYDLIGSSGEVLAQLQDVSLGLSHVAHQQQFLWKMIRDRVNLDVAATTPNVGPYGGGPGHEHSGR